MKTNKESKLRQTMRITMRANKLGQSLRKTKGQNLKEINVSNYLDENTILSI